MVLRNSTDPSPSTPTRPRASQPVKRESARQLPSATVMTGVSCCWPVVPGGGTVEVTATKTIAATRVQAVWTHRRKQQGV